MQRAPPSLLPLEEGPRGAPHENSLSSGFRLDSQRQLRPSPRLQILLTSSWSSIRHPPAAQLPDERSNSGLGCETLSIQMTGTADDEKKVAPQPDSRSFSSSPGNKKIIRQYGFRSTPVKLSKRRRVVIQSSSSEGVEGSQVVQMPSRSGSYSTRSRPTPSDADSSSSLTPVSDFEAATPVSRGVSHEAQPIQPTSSQIAGRSHNGSGPGASSKLAKQLRGQTEEVQAGVCRIKRYRGFPRCVSCAKAQRDEPCRFIGFRIFPLNPKTAQINGDPVFRSCNQDVQPLRFSSLNRSIGLSEIFQAEAAVVPLLLPMITEELHCAVVHDGLSRERDADFRSLCDFCSSTMFSGFFCRDCAKEFCRSCRDSMPTTATSKLGPSVSWSQRDVRWRCKPNPGQHHHQAQLQAIGQLTRQQLERHWCSLAASALGLQETATSLSGSPLALERQRVFDEKQQSPPPATALEATYGTATTMATHPVDPASLESQSLKVSRLGDMNELSDGVFNSLWSRGEPIVIGGCADKLHLDWTPAGFVERHGEQCCSIVDCESDETFEQTVGDFFAAFGKPDSERRMLKLKDWPPTSEFKDSFPDLYEDFNRALPVPDYTRRDGVRNLSAHFPDGPSRPDLGPKMYIAYAAHEAEGSQGTTRLHMDVADAINIMVYASDDANGMPGCAVWDIFRASDADAVRGFLSIKFRKIKFVDPIHSQLFYLDSALRRELYETTGVASWRIYQRPGEAIFIQAGCAHQVCNLADCIKIAMDFVSPHHVSRCLELTNDFRKENFRRVWKDDVLQLFNVLWYAWLSCQEAKHELEAGSGTEASQAASAERLLRVALRAFDQERERKDAPIKSD